MPRNQVEIKDLISEIKIYHGKRLEQQRVDQEYYDDVFPIFQRDKDIQVVRTGNVKEDIETVVSLIDTSSPQVVRYPKNETKRSAERNERVSKLLNYLALLLGRNNPQPFKELVKKQTRRGEAWIQLVTDTDWKSSSVPSFPVKFVIHDPLIVYGSPDENDMGKPEFVVVEYQRSSRQLLREYPEYKQTSKDKETVVWFFDDNIQYCTIGSNEVVFKANGFGFTPFIHMYSGLGDRDPEGRPENLAMSVIRNKRGNYREEEELRTEIAHQLRNYTWPLTEVKNTVNPQEEVPEAFLQNFKLTPRQILDTTGVELNIHTAAVPDQALYQYLFTLKGEQAGYLPPILQGLGSGNRSTGRKEDILGSYALQRYRGLFRNTEIGVANAMGYMLKLIEKFPALDPPFIHKGDIEEDYVCDFQFRVKDKLEEERKGMMGLSWLNAGRIDWKTFLVEFAGYSPDRAGEIIRAVRIDNILNSPVMAQSMAMTLMKELGYEQELEQQQAMLQASQNVPTDQLTMGGVAGPRGGEPRRGNIQSAEGFEMIDQVLTQRRMRE